MTPSEPVAPRALQFATLAVALVAAGTYAMSELLGRTGSVLPLLGLFACAYAPRLARHRPLGPAGAALLAFGVIGIAVIDWWLITGDAVMALGRAVLGLQFVRFWAPLRSRERLQVFVLSLTHLAAASVLTVDILFAVFLAAYALVVTSALMLQYLHAEALACGAPPPRTSGRLLLGMSGLAIVGVLLTAAFFVIVPRVGAGLLQANLSRRTVKIAGFSDSVRIGDIGQILLGSDTVMEILFTDGGDGRLTRFRGRVFEDSKVGPDGRYIWMVPDLQGRQRKVSIRVLATDDANLVRAERDVLRDLLRTEDAPTGGAAIVRHEELVNYEVHLAPLDSAALFTAGPPREVAFHRTAPVPKTVYVDPDGTVVQWGHPQRNAADQVIYEMSAWMMPENGAAAVAPRPTDPDVIARCRRLPTGIPPGLAQRLRRTADAWTDSATDALDAAESIERRLRETGGYRYTLDQPDPGSGDPIEHFLYRAKAGHCEYYAVSMVMLLRSQQHPARLVNGFLGGEVNPIDGRRLVRQSDAHAWVEVLGNDGWHAYNPTPRADEPPGSMAIFRQFFEYLRFRWYSGVVDYDLRDQQRALQGGMSQLRQWGDSLRRAPAGIARSLRSWRGALGVTCIVVGVWLLFFRRRGARADRLQRPAIAFYADLVRWLARRGLERRPGQTPRELAVEARGLRGVPWDAIDTLTELFCAARYGGDRLDDATRVRAEAALEALP